MTAPVRTTTATVDGAVYRTDCRASVNLVYHNHHGHGRPQRREEKITEQNLVVRRGKSEAEVTNNRRLHSTYCNIEANC